MQSKRIIAVHLLNDWSGSPLVFRQALEALQQPGVTLTLFTATPSDGGFLSDLAGVSTQAIQYQWSASKLLTLWNFLSVQLRLFGQLFFLLRSTDTVYINTLLPFGAALAGKLRGCRVVYHVHEVSIKPRLLKTWLRCVASFTAQQALFVSDYTLRETALSGPTGQLVYNALPALFSNQACLIGTPNTGTPFTALMLCSNKAYKGIDEFVMVARHLPTIRFLLVLNTTSADVDTFIKRTKPPHNCFVYPAQADTIPFYRQAHVVLNLSHPDAWVETFGMTILESMACGRPVIVPPVGGICELIEAGKEGFVLDARQPLALANALRTLSSDMALYERMAQAARQRSAFFSASVFRRAIVDVFSPATPAPGCAVRRGNYFQNQELSGKPTG